MRQILKSIALSLTMAALPVAAVASQSVKKAVEAVPGIKIEKAEVKRNGDLMSVDLTLDLRNLDVNRNRALLIVPAFINKSDTIRMDPIGIYGSTRYAQQERLGHPLGDVKEKMVRSGSRTMSQPLDYHVVIPYCPVMEGASLVLLLDNHGCCNKVLDKACMGPLAEFHTPTPEPFDMGEPMWVLPDVATLQMRERNTKNRALTGSAYIDFPVNKTAIYPDYRDNAAELGKIRSTLDVVFTDPDVTVKAIFIKGFASPEGPYANNVLLAKGRTESLRDYVRSVYKLPEAVFTTAFEAEDWNGLRDAVERLDIADRRGLLDIINSDMAPDAKDAALKKRYPADYRYLLAEVYPALRHSDYRIDYLVRDYEEPAIIEAVMNRDATKLSPEEFYIAASSHEPGSTEFIAIYAMALKYYPDDPVCNYNMAVAALLAGDLAATEARLAKAGDMPQTEWARKVIEEIRAYNERLLNK